MCTAVRMRWLSGATEKFENARSKVSGLFINAAESRQIIWTKGTTERLETWSRYLGAGQSAARWTGCWSPPWSTHFLNLVCPWQNDWLPRRAPRWERYRWMLPAPIDMAAYAGLCWMRRVEDGFLRTRSNAFEQLNQPDPGKIISAWRQ